MKNTNPSFTDNFELLSPLSTIEPDETPVNDPNQTPEIEPEKLPAEEPGVHPLSKPDDDDDDDPFTETEIGDDPDEISKKTTIMW